MERVDTVVVGAGVSGLRVALELQKAGRSVVVLEGRPRIGGRLFSRSVADGTARFDLGATWIWRTEPRVNRLVDELGLETFSHPEDGAVVYETAAGVQRHPALRDARGPLRIVGGPSALAAALAERLAPEPILLGHVVRSVVREKGRGLKVETTDGTVVRGRHVVLAVPPALAASSIVFEPELPPEIRRLAEMTPVWMGNIVKTVVSYDRPFWREAGFSGAAISHHGPLEEIHDVSGPGGAPAGLFGFSTARPGVGAPSSSAVLDQLQRLFGPEAASAREVLSQDWRSEPLTSPPGVEALDAFPLYGHPAYARPLMGGALHWSSCETSSASGSMGHIEDALAAAERAAAAILADHRG